VLDENKLNRAHDFFSKAEKLSRWSGLAVQEIMKHGEQKDLNIVEMYFWSLLAMFGSIHESLVDAARKIGWSDWRDEMQKIRNSDELLYYMWKARDSEMHDALVKWKPGSKLFMMKVTNETNYFLRFGGRDPRVSQIDVMCYLYDVKTPEELSTALDEKPLPDILQQYTAGVTLSPVIFSFSLNSFLSGQGTKTMNVPAPNSHLGAMFAPSANAAALSTHQFYAGKVNEMKEKLQAIMSTLQCNTAVHETDKVADCL